MGSILQDIRYAARTLFAHRHFTVAVIVLLGLGIGASATVFTVVERVLLTPLPYRAPEQLVQIWERNIPGNFSNNVVNPQNYLDWRDRATSFRDLGAFTWSQLTLTGGGEPERLYGRSVTANLFAILGSAPSLGRTFSEEESRPNGPRAVILSDGLWRRRFGADPAIVGRSIQAAGGAVTVVGVMPASFRPLATEEYWDPFPLDPAVRKRSGRYAMVLGRLKPGITPEVAGAEMARIAAQLEREYPTFDTGWSTNVVPLAEQVVGSSKRVLWILLAAVSLVLLITCANVGNLMLTRAAAREREVAVRTALGAPRWRLVRGWLTENLLLALGGGALGLALASYGVALLVAAGPEGLPRLHEIALDRRVVVVTAAITLIVGLLIGAPAILQRRAAQLAAGLRSAGGRSAGSVRGSRFRAALVVTQTSLAVVLLLAAGLLVRSVSRLTRVDPGFDPRDLLTLAISLPSDRYPDIDRQAAFFAGFSDRLRALPGVTAVGAVSFLPLQPGNAATGFSVIGQPEPAAGQGPSAAVRIVDPGYFAAMRIPVRQGRALTSEDRAHTTPVVVVSEALARKTWPGEDPVGRRIKVAYAHSDDVLEVVGVVGDVRHSGLDADVRETIYYPAAQYNYGSLTFVVRTGRDPAALAPAVRRVLHEMDPQLPAEDVATMDHWMSESMSDRRDPMFLLTIFAVFAVTIAAVGIYAVLSFGVQQRTRELGVRIALGARPGEVLALVVGGGLRLTLAGIAIGALAGTLGARALGGLLYGVTPGDPTTLIGVAALLVGVALLAMYIPARRAARVDPMVALRYE